MDARSIAATAARGGLLTGADEIDFDETIPPYAFDAGVYEKRVFSAAKPQPEAELQFGPNIRDWPEFPAMKRHLLLRVVSVLDDAVTTTDELIPSGETSSFRSNPQRLAEFALSRRDPGYVGRAKAAAVELPGEIEQVLAKLPERFAPAPPANRLPAASAYWAAQRTSPANTRRSVTAPTASTGACCPSPPKIAKS